MVMTDDSLVYLGKVAEWLKSCPEQKFEYGEFYVSKVIVSFDGETIGTFTSDDPCWMYESAKYES